jgi:hypothetical protein
VPASIWGVYQEEGAFLWCAKFLALSPFGRKMAMVDAQEKTAYDSRLTALLRAVVPRQAVT